MGERVDDSFGFSFQYSFLLFLFFKIVLFYKRRSPSSTIYKNNVFRNTVRNMFSFVFSEKSQNIVLIKRKQKPKTGRPQKKEKKGRRILEGSNSFIERCTINSK